MSGSHDAEVSSWGRSGHRMFQFIIAQVPLPELEQKLKASLRASLLCLGAWVALVENVPEHLGMALGC